MVGETGMAEGFFERSMTQDCRISQERCNFVGGKIVE